MKQHRKLMGLGVKAQSCLSREQAQKLIRKAEKARQKLRRWLDGQTGTGQLAEGEGEFGGSGEN